MASLPYNAMLLRIEHRMSKGLSLVAAYTLSKLIDDMLPAVNGFPGESFSGAPLQNFYDIRSERALASWDTPQTLVLSYVYELPFGRGKHFLTQGGPFGKIVGGWQINGNTTFQSGFPFQVNGGNGSGSFAGTQRPNRSGKDATLSGPVTDHLLRYFDTTVFSFNAPFTFGNAPRLMPTPAESRVRQLRYVGVQEPASHVAAGRANKDSNCWRDKARDWESIGSAQKSVASTIWGEV